MTSLKMMQIIIRNKNNRKSTSEPTIKDKKIITAQYKSPYQLLANSPKNLTIHELLTVTVAD